MILLYLSKFKANFSMLEMTVICDACSLLILTVEKILHGAFSKLRIRAGTFQVVGTMLRD